MADESPTSDGKKPLFNLRHFVFQATKQAPTAISSAITGALLATLGWYLASAAPHLSYTVTPPVSFAGQKVQFGIVSVSVVNDGSKEAEAVICELDLKGCSIRDIRVGPPVLEPTHTLEKGRATIKVNSLNAGETLQIAVETGDVDSLTDPPKVSVRGKNTKGELRLPKSDNDSITSRVVAWVAFILVLITNIYSIFFDRRDKIFASQNNTIKELTTIIKSQTDTLNNAGQAMDQQTELIEQLKARLDRLTKETTTSP